MALIQIRDVPDHIYRLLAKGAEEERRSLAQQTVAVLARGLNAEIDAKGRRRKTLQAIQAGGSQTRKVSDPAKLIREDRRLVRLVLDASAAIEVVLSRTKAAAFTQALGEADEVLAPDLFVAEVVNTVWKYHQFESLDLNACDRALEHALSLIDALVPCKELYREAFLLARSARRPAYDMFYLSLARREDASFLTTDSALRKEASRQGIRTV